MTVARNGHYCCSHQCSAALEADRTTLCSSTCAKLFSFLTHPPAARGWSDGAVNAKSKREASKLRTLRFEAARLAPLELVSVQIRKAFNKGYEFKQKILPLGPGFQLRKTMCNFK